MSDVKDTLARLRAVRTLLIHDFPNAAKDISDGIRALERAEAVVEAARRLQERGIKGDACGEIRAIYELEDALTAYDRGSD